VFLTLAARAHAQSTGVQRMLEDADSAFSHRDYRKAASLFDRAIAAEPHSVDPAFYAKRADVFVFEKKYADGLAWLDGTAAPVLGKSAILDEKKALLLAGAGRVEEGVTLAETVVAGRPDAYALEILIGDFRFNSGADGAARAAAAYGAYLKSRPDALASGDRLIRLKMAYADLALADYPNADAELGRAAALKDAPGVDTTRTLAVARCTVQAAEQRWTEAEATCAPLAVDAAGAADPDPALFYNLSRAHLGAGNVAAAGEAANRYGALRPGTVRAFLLSGDVAVGRNDLASAEAAFLAAERIDHEDAEIAQRLGRVYLSMNPPRPADAAGRLQRAHEKNPGDLGVSTDLAEALGLLGKPADVVALLENAVDAAPEHRKAQLLLGVALVDVDRVTDAVPHLQVAQADAGDVGKRARAALIDALNRIAVVAIQAGKVPDAEAALLQAKPLGDSPLTIRDLALVDLMKGDAAGATALLTGPGAGTDVTSLHILGRAQVAAGKIDDGARTLAKAAAGAAGDPDVAMDLAAVLIDHDPNGAVAALEPVASAAKPAVQVLEAYATAARAAAGSAMENGRYEAAYQTLARAEKLAAAAIAPATLLGLRCDLALAAAGSGLRDTALARLHDLDKAKAVCPFAPPADQLAVPILSSWAEGLDSKQAAHALDRLDGLRHQATGSAAVLLREAGRVVALRAAADAFANGSANQARDLVAAARKFDPDGKSPELLLDTAVLDLENGKLDAAIAELSPLETMPEALISLGIAYARKGDPVRALGYFHKAADAGSSFGPLRGWIAAKERLWGTP
jgi:predicted Zn-dependent protease